MVKILLILTGLDHSAKIHSSDIIVTKLELNMHCYRFYYTLG